jgi:hypothetical protein
MGAPTGPGELQRVIEQEGMPSVPRAFPASWGRGYLPAR